MKHIDEERGFKRTILLGDQPGHTTQGDLPITNCVVEVIESDPVGGGPALSLRFYVKPFYDHQTASELAEGGHPVCDAETPIGVEINLGPDLVQSLIGQINTQWPQYLQILQSQRDDDGTVGEEVDE